jgi:tetratricopeptide (TPR) repeat protein
VTKGSLIAITILLLCGTLIVPTRVLGQVNVPYGARMNGGKIYYNQERYDKAAEQFEFAIAENPASAEARIWLGMAQSHLKKYMVAAAQFDTAFGLDSAYFNKMLQKNEDFKYQASTSFFDATRENLNQNDTNQLKDALRYAKQVLRIDPKNRPAQTILAQLYVQLNQLDELKQSARAMLSSDAENPLSYTMMGLYFFNQSQWDSAHYYYLEAAKRQEVIEQKSKTSLGSLLGITDTIQLNQVITRLLAAYRDRNPERLRKLVEDSLKAKQKFPLVARNVNDLYLSQGELNTSFFRAGAANLQKANTDTAKSKQEQYFKHAESEFEQALIYNPSDMVAKQYLAFIFYRKGDPVSDEQAMNLYAEIMKASVLQLDDPMVPSELADSILSMITSNVIMQKYIPLPNEYEVKIEDALIKKGSELTGWQWLYFPKASQAKTPTIPVDKKDVFLSNSDPQSLENLELLYGVTLTNVATNLKQQNKIDEANKKYDEAISNFELILALNPKNIDALTSLRVCYREKGDKQKAEEILQRLDALRKQK